MSIISAVTLKRKKSLKTNLLDSSADEDSEHQPVKASNYRGEEEDVKGEEGQIGEANREQTNLKNERQNENGGEAPETTLGKNSLEGGVDTDKEKKERGSRQRSSLLRNATKLHLESFFCSHHQIQAINPKCSTMTNQLSNRKSNSLARGSPTVPFWICPNRFPNLSDSSSFHRSLQPDSAPVHYRKAIGGRTRPTSMNLDLELGCRAERVEVIKVIEGTPHPHGCVGFPHRSAAVPRSNQPIDLTPFVSQEALHLSSSSAWINQSSTGSSTVVLRRSGLGPREKMRAWHRHTVIV